MNPVWTEDVLKDPPYPGMSRQQAAPWAKRVRSRFVISDDNHSFYCRFISDEHGQPIDGPWQEVQWPSMREFPAERSLYNAVGVVLGTLYLSPDWKDDAIVRIELGTQDFIRYPGDREAPITPVLCTWTGAGDHKIKTVSKFENQHIDVWHGHALLWNGFNYESLSCAEVSALIRRWERQLAWDRRRRGFYGSFLVADLRKMWRAFMHFLRAGW